MRRPNRAYYPTRPDGTASRLALGSLRMLAGLLLADGRIVSSVEIGRWATPWGSPRGSVASWVRVLREHGVEIQAVRPSGYRLAALPPDDLIEDVLTVARQLRREQPMRLWHLMGIEERPLTREDRRRLGLRPIQIQRSRARRSA